MIIHIHRHSPRIRCFEARSFSWSWEIICVQDRFFRQLYCPIPTGFMPCPCAGINCSTLESLDCCGAQRVSSITAWPAWPGLYVYVFLRVIFRLGRLSCLLRIQYVSRAKDIVYLHSALIRGCAKYMCILKKCRCWCLNTIIYLTLVCWNMKQNYEKF